MVINETLSSKIKDIQFIAIILVVLEHSYFINLPIPYVDVFKVNSFIQTFFSTGLCKIAVPIFFIISGYLFFNSSSPYLEKLKKRSKTLLFPYLFFSLLYFSILFLGKYIISGENILNPNNDFFSKIFGSNSVAYQLWFIRDLIILAIISPILNWLIRNKYLRLIYIITIFLVWLLIKAEASWERVYGSFLFFSIGGMINLSKNYFNKINVTLLVIFWTSLVIIKSFYEINFESQNTKITDILLKISMIFGIFSLWNIYEYVKDTKIFKRLKEYNAYTFIIYLLHAPYLLFLIRSVILKLLKTNEFFYILNYFVSPFMTIIISIFLGKILKKHMPSIYNVITGNR